MTRCSVRLVTERKRAGAAKILDSRESHPFAVVNLLLFTAPLGDPVLEIVYFILIIMIYDFVYTIFSTNQLALFSEMFKTEQKRSRANTTRNVLLIVGVLLGAVLPTMIVKPMVQTLITAGSCLE